MGSTEYKLLIPIKNIYYMLSYAFGVLKQDGFAMLDSEEFENIYDLLSEILIKGIESQIIRGIYKEYIPVNKTMKVLRGKVNLIETIKEKSRFNQALHCSYSEFSSNNLLNQIIKTTCIALLKNNDITDAKIKRLHYLMKFFGEIDTIPLRNINWLQLKYHKNNITYKMLINICYLICEGLIITETSGSFKFEKFLKDRQMAALYEKFVYEFYKKECKDVEVSYQQQIKWRADDGYIEILPKMHTDISLTKGIHRLMIDTKFYPEAMQMNYLSNNKSFISGNLYQIFAYVKNCDFTGRISGMLLYPTVRYDLDKNYKLSGNDFFIRTVDLNKGFTEIKECLLRIKNLV